MKSSGGPVREELQRVSFGFRTIDGPVSGDLGHRGFGEWKQPRVAGGGWSSGWKSE